MAAFTLKIIDCQAEGVGDGKCIENDEEDEEESYPDEGVFLFDWMDSWLQYGGVKGVKIINFCNKGVLLSLAGFYFEVNAI